MNKKVSINIESLVLVANWEKPFIFQGSFTITNKADGFKFILLFRCQCYLESQIDIIEMDFSPDDYQFTHLYNSQSAVHLTNKDSKLQQALYLLKYVLNETLKKMIVNPKHYFTQIDEVAMANLSQQIENHMTCYGRKKLDHDDIGFAVSIDFLSTEKNGRDAALTLLALNQVL